MKIVGSGSKSKAVAKMKLVGGLLWFEDELFVDFGI